ncbi:helix-turn-helix transcriptional regulator [Brevibacillus laterosporus]|uniref:helix-turn-helix domain-containing protein n=1 Tax=Brevibacillus laterosporus TaxID=1465 RepID=UPI003D1FE931
MIKCNLAVILAERGLKITDVAKATGISRTTLTALYYNQGKGIQFDTLDLLCEQLGIPVSQLISHHYVDFEIEEYTWINQMELDISCFFTVDDITSKSKINLLIKKVHIAEIPEEEEHTTITLEVLANIWHTDSYFLTIPETRLEELIHEELFGVLSESYEKLEHLEIEIKKHYA